MVGRQRERLTGFLLFLPLLFPFPCPGRSFGTMYMNYEQHIASVMLMLP